MIPEDGTAIALVLADEPAAPLREVILDGLRGYNSAAFDPAPTIRTLAVAIEQDGAAVGGLWGRTGWGWLVIELIFVPESLRGRGLARRLIGMAEDEARRRGCHAAWLDTLNPEALRLYQRLGYGEFGALDDYPVGGRRVFLQKRL